MADPAEIHQLEVLVGNRKTSVLVPELTNDRPRAWSTPGDRHIRILGAENRVLAEGRLGPEGASTLNAMDTLSVIEIDAHGPKRANKVPKING